MVISAAVYFRIIFIIIEKVTIDHANISCQIDTKLIVCRQYPNR